MIKEWRRISLAGFTQGTSMTAFRVFTSGNREKRRGHGAYLNIGVSFQFVDNQAQAVEALTKERARRSLYAGCDRAPLDWEKDVA